MRGVLLTVIVLILAAIVCCMAGDPLTSHSPAGSSAPPATVTADDSPWRRTAAGWERNDRWSVHRPRVLAEGPTVAAFHPLLMALFLLMACGGLLLAGHEPPPARSGTPGLLGR